MTDWIAEALLVEELGADTVRNLKSLIDDRIKAMRLTPREHSPDCVKRYDCERGYDQCEGFR